MQLKKGEKMAATTIEFHLPMQTMPLGLSHSRFIKSTFDETIDDENFEFSLDLRTIERISLGILKKVN